MTNDNGLQLVNIQAGSNIYNEIKSLGACLFYAWGSYSPAIGKAALRELHLMRKNSNGIN
ncbi:hypothetical protein C5695_15480 [Bacillus pumilus]|uniref:Uncharacterized protein n=1 Tax=Bacillus pumilus TaxID=1408 RepID=A0AAD0HPL6_BACPU|nr:hypothetical protein C5695_15480 [Bacillus pumilus]